MTAECFASLRMQPCLFGFDDKTTCYMVVGAPYMMLRPIIGFDEGGELERAVEAA